MRLSEIGCKLLKMIQKYSAFSINLNWKRNVHQLAEIYIK